MDDYLILVLINKIIKNYKKEKLFKLKTNIIYNKKEEIKKKWQQEEGEQLEQQEELQEEEQEDK